MKAIILAAGVGKRLGGAANLPKALLRFGSKTLLQRHIEILANAAVTDIAIVVGHGAEAVEEEVMRLRLPFPVRFVPNPRYREGSIVSLWSAREVLREGASVIVMDADVLYDVRLMRPLLTTSSENCFLLDRDLEAGDEPQKLCIRNGAIVDLDKRPKSQYDWHGESIGFTRLSPSFAVQLADRTEEYVRSGRTGVEHEEALRDLIVSSPPGAFGYVDVTGIPWLEIDFPEDVARATNDILPKLIDA